MGGDDVPVTFGRWAAEHAALAGRVAALEAAAARGRERAWTLALTVLAGLALPVLVVLVLAVIRRGTS
jgi:hypothetical protein